ncbi:MAG: flagellar brake protein [Ectothiorhodospira sp.]
MSDPSASLIRNRRRQQTLFRELIKGRALLTLSATVDPEPAPEGEEEGALVHTPLRLQGVSQLLQLAPENDRLALEAPNNEVMMRRLAPGTELRVRASLRGVPLLFRTVYEGLHEEGDVQALVCHWPEVVDYRQRRGAFRVSVPMALEARAHWCLDEGGDEDRPVYSARPADVSIQGLGLDCELDPGDVPPSGTGVLIRTLEMGEYRWTDLPAVVRNVKPDPRHEGRCRLGLQFSALPPAAERSLNRLIMDLQQDAAKRV